jgi:putative tricarboxylic transport membrane protein
MTLRTDHVTGGIAIAFGVLVLAISGELPVGSLSFPGAGLWPKLLATLTIVVGLVLIAGARDGEAFTAIRWSDVTHALPVLALAAAAVAFYETLGFIISIGLMLFCLALLKKKPPLHALVFGAGVSLSTYVLFTMVLKSPLERGLFGF